MLLKKHKQTHKLLSSIFSVMLVVILLTSLFTGTITANAEDSAGPAMKAVQLVINCDDIIGSKLFLGADGETTVKLRANGAQDLYGFDMTFDYDTSVFELGDITADSNFAADSTKVYMTKSDDGSGHVRILGTLLDADKGVSGNINIVDIQLTAKNQDTSTSFGIEKGAQLSDSSADPANVYTIAEAESISVAVKTKTESIGGGGTPVTQTTNQIPVETKTDSNSNVTATLDSSKINVNSVNVINVDQPKPESAVQVQIPASSVGMGTGSFEINTNSVSMDIPTSVVDQSQLQSGQTLQVCQNELPAAGADSLLVNIPLGAKTNGKVFNFSMAVCDSNSNVVSNIHNFASGKSVTVTINLTDEDIQGTDTSKLSAFYFDTASNSWVDLGGTFDPVKRTYTFTTTHFTNFAILEKPAVNVQRLSGADRIGTSIAIAKELYKDGQPGAVVLATANDFADALAGSGLAYKFNAPLLLVDDSPVDNQPVYDYITANLSKNKNVYILGGTGAVSSTVLDYLTSQGYNVIRIGGSDRYDTNQKIVDYMNTAKGTSIVIATGNDFADGLSISSIADIKGYPVLLNGKDNLLANISSDITNIGPSTVYIIGGTGAISANVEAQIKKLNGNINIVRLGGNDRYETSMMIADYFNLNTNTISVATGVNFPDALSGSVLAARKNSSVLLIDNKDVTKQKELLAKENIDNVILFGGEGAISRDIAASLIQK